MSLTFIEETHSYEISGVTIPSVTQIIGAAGLNDFSGVNPGVLERSANFGTAVHKAIELQCKESLDWNTVDSAIKPWIKNWNKFTEDFKFTAGSNEVRGYHPIYRYGYTIDAIGIADEKRTKVDIKTGNPKPSDIIQISGYDMAKPTENNLILYIKEDGYKVVKVGKSLLKKGQQVFLSALTIYNFKKENKLC